MTVELSFAEKCQNYLTEKWNHIMNLSSSQEIKSPLGDNLTELKNVIIDCLTSNIKSYRYVLPTQILSKAVDHSLDCRSLQVADDRQGAFDARTIAHKVIVPFDQQNHNVLGGSAEPYVNNPLRCTSVSIENRERQRNKADWDKLIFVLDTVQNWNDLIFTKLVFDQILIGMYKLLGEVSVIYPVPNRISLKQTIKLIETYITEKSGGDRLEAVVTSLFRTISDKFNLFDKVKREKVNAADATSGMVADIECWLNNEIVLLIEVKDRKLTLTQLAAKLDIARAKQISEIIIMAQQGADSTKAIEMNNKIDHEFISGQNVYITNLPDFSSGILMLLGEKGRVDFISKVGPELDTSKSSIINRKAWASLLREV